MIPENPDDMQMLHDLFRLDGHDGVGRPGQPDFDGEFCRRLAAAAAAQRASVFRLDPDGQTIRLAFGLGVENAEAYDVRLRLGEGICGAACLSRRPIWVFNAAATPQHDTRISDLVGFQVGSLACAPIQFNGRLYGAIEILNCLTQPVFPDHWKDRLVWLGQLYGAALALAEATSPAAGADSPVKRKRARAADSGHRGPGLPACASSSVAIPPREPHDCVIGASYGMRQALEACLRAGRSDDPALIRGESGVGKELAARRIHDASARRDGPFLAVNCAALPEQMLESELFGHVAGAFTSAHRDRRGWFVAASGGSLFLDEIGDMPLACQSKILRALEERRITPLGSDTPSPTDARIIAATNRDLWQAVLEGRFRKDLYFRICGVEILIPPLRERREDIALLAEHFLREAAAEQPAPSSGATEPALAPETLGILERHDWPGNVRELRQAVRSALALAEDNRISPEALPPRIREALSAGGASVCPESPSGALEQRPVEALRREYLRALEQTAYAGSNRWNLAAAARQIGVPRKTFEYQLKRMKLK